MNGPFGKYDRGSVGDVLNAMCELEKIPLMFVENVQIGFIQPGEGEIHHQGDRVGRFHYFDGLEQPLFMWSHEKTRAFRRQFIEIDGKGNQYPKFRLTLGVHDMPVFEIDGSDATAELHKFMRYPMLTNLTDHICYGLNQAAGGFFQGGSHDENGQWVMVEFWKPAGAQAWVDYLNKEYRPNKTIYSDKVEPKIEEEE